MRYSILFILCAVISLPANAQNRPNPAVLQGENLQVPENWIVRLDHKNPEVQIGSNPDSSDIYFVNMTPGWHITTGPAAIFYHPENRAEGNYSLSTVMYYFNPGKRNREAYGLFFGGRNLEDANQQYIYFLIRNTGEYLIKKRNGEETSVIQNWTASDAVVKYENTDEPSVKNELSVQIEGDKMSFTINGKKVSEIEKTDLQTDGLYGLRINHSINVHVADLKLEKN